MDVEFLQPFVEAYITFSPKIGPASDFLREHKEERERERQTERETETDRETERETESQRQTVCDTQKNG